MVCYESIGPMGTCLFVLLRINEVVINRIIQDMADISTPLKQVSSHLVIYHNTFYRYNVPTFFVLFYSISLKSNFPPLSKQGVIGKLPITRIDRFFIQFSDAVLSSEGLARKKDLGKQF